MGIRCRCIRVAPADLDALQADAQAFVLGFDVDHLGGAPETAKATGIEKTWHAPSYLLERSSGPAADFFFTGVPLAEDLGYGPPFFMDADLVRATATTLHRTPADALLAHYDAQAMQQAEIYPATWDSDEDDLNQEWLRGHYQKLTRFSAAAAHSGDAVVMALT